MFNRNVYTIANKLVIDGSVYPCNNLNMSHSEIHPRTISRRENHNYVLFGGKLSLYKVLSNFYKRIGITMHYHFFKPNIYTNHLY